MAPVFICVCMTAALNPLTGGGMSPAPPTIHCTAVVCVTAPREGDELGVCVCANLKLHV